MLEVVGANLSRVKPMTYQIYTRHYVVWRLPLLRMDEDWFAYYVDNLTEWDVGWEGIAGG